MFARGDFTLTFPFRLEWVVSMVRSISIAFFENRDREKEKTIVNNELYNVSIGERFFYGLCQAHQLQRNRKSIVA